MARKKTKTSNETSGVPAAEERAAAPVAATTDAAVPDTAAAGEAEACDTVTETNLPVPRAVAPRPTKKSKKGATPKASTPKGRAPKAPKAIAPTIQEDANKPRKLSALDAAAKVLEEAGQPMNCQEMIGAMAAKGYWTSPAGKTPAATLCSALLREIKTKTSQGRFQKAARGQFVYQTPKAS
jgi:HB1, ASXL, restriction endonuclease HTH domain